MARIRAFEELVRDLYVQGAVAGSGHSYLGEEAVAAGVCSVMDDRDRVVGTYRGHGHAIASGVEMAPLLAEVLGLPSGCCGGRMGGMHGVGGRMPVATGIVGQGSPIACGIAFALQRAGEGGLCAVFFGDGASDRGTQHEAMNLAALWKLPLVFVCENNGFAFYTARERHQTVGRIADRAAGYAMPGVTVDGNDALAVADAMEEAAERARAGGGPTLIECLTWRWTGHCIHDSAPYKDPEEQRRWVEERDPLELLAARLRASHVGDRVLASVRASAAAEAQAALAAC